MELQTLVNTALKSMSTHQLAREINKSQPSVWRMSKGLSLKTDIETIRKLEEIVSQAPGVSVS